MDGTEKNGIQMISVDVERNKDCARRPTLSDLDGKYRRGRPKFAIVPIPVVRKSVAPLRRVFVHPIIWLLIDLE